MRQEWMTVDDLNMLAGLCQSDKQSLPIVNQGYKWWRLGASSLFPCISSVRITWYYQIHR